MKKTLIGVLCLLFLLPLGMQAASLVHKFYDVEILNSLTVDNVITADNAVIGTATIDNLTVTGGFTTFRGALVFLGNNNVTQEIGHTKIVMDNVAYDTDGVFDNGAKRFIVPSGVSYVKLYAQVWRSFSSTAQPFWQVTINKNGNRYYAGSGFVMDHSPDNVFGVMTVFTPPLPVQANDYFELYNFSDGVLSGDTDGSQTWFAIEIL